MIQALIEASVRRLREELGELIPNPDAHVFAGPIPPMSRRELPRIVLSAGRLEIDTTTREGAASGLRPQLAEERLQIDVADRGPFSLAHSPLKGTVRVGLLLAARTVAEHTMPLEEGSDFEADYGNSLLILRTNLKARLAAHAADLRARAQSLAGRSFNVDAPEELSRILFDVLRLPPPPGEPTPGGYYAVTREVLEDLAPKHPLAPCVLAYWAAQSGPSVLLRVEYSFPGVFTVREFEQTMLVDVHGTDGAEVSMLSSLTAAILLTDQEMLRQQASVAYATGKTVSTTHSLTKLDLAEGVPEATDAGAHVRLAFRVAGNLRLMREARDGLAVVEQVGTPAVIPPAPIALRAELS